QPPKSPLRKRLRPRRQPRPPKSDGLAGAVTQPRPSSDQCVFYAPPQRIAPRPSVTDLRREIVSAKTAQQDTRANIVQAQLAALQCPARGHLAAISKERAISTVGIEPMMDLTAI